MFAEIWRFHSIGLFEEWDSFQDEQFAGADLSSDFSPSDNGDHDIKQSTSTKHLSADRRDANSIWKGLRVHNRNEQR
jgi:hypothetical protein